MGYRQDLDNGVMNKPSYGGSGTRQSRGRDFSKAIAEGENEHGQTTIAPSAVIREGRCVYDQENYPNNQQGNRWSPKGK